MWGGTSIKRFLLLFCFRKIFQKSLVSDDKNNSIALQWNILCSLEIIILNTVSNMKNIGHVMLTSKIKKFKVATLLKLQDSDENSKETLIHWSGGMVRNFIVSHSVV